MMTYTRIWNPPLLKPFFFYIIKKGRMLCNTTMIHKLPQIRIINKPTMTTPLPRKQSYSQLEKQHHPIPTYS